MAAPLVFFDIAGPDEAALRAFYAKVFSWQCGMPGQFRPGNLSNIAANIRQDPAETVFYVGVPDVEEALQDVEEAGGTIDVPRFEASGTAILGLFRDPAGNRVGLVEIADGEPVIP